MLACGDGVRALLLPFDLLISGVKYSLHCHGELASNPEISVVCKNGLMAGNGAHYLPVRTLPSRRAIFIGVFAMNQNQEAVEFIKQAIEAFDALATLEAILESKDVSMDAFQKITDSLKHLPFSKIRGAIMLAHANDIVASMEKANDGVDSLYVASCEHVPGRYKIGRTTQDPHRRVAQFRTGAPDAKLVLHYQGLGSLERKVHKLLKECRVGRSEWFSCSIDNVHDAVSLAFDGDVDAVRIDAKQD